MDVGGDRAVVRTTYRKMIQNLIWATGYNVVASPLAAGALSRGAWWCIGRIQPVVATPLTKEVFIGRPAGWMQKLTGRGAIRSHRSRISHRLHPNNAEAIEVAAARR